ncbi:MAG: L-seryl-tRNA selenium transferase, partial [Campylobacter sp.]|nr:L-seryl-tRNA selenium transferase [Campylobacter sp.]
FEPFDENVAGKTSFVESLPAKIINATAQGATLANGNVISKNGVNSNIKLAKGEKFLGEFEGKFIYTTEKGALKVSDESGNLLVDTHIDTQALSAAINGDDLAVVAANNSVYLIKISSNSIVLNQKLREAYAVDSRVASPIFVEQLVVYPSLDGLLVVADRHSGRIVRNIVVSNQPFFNNSIDLKLLGDNMYATTPTKILLVSTMGNRSYNGEIRSVLFGNDRIYAFLKDGVVDMLDLNLNKIKSKKFTFALFAGAGIAGNSLNIVEKTGYLIKTDLNLENEQIFELNDEIDEKTFVNSHAFYHDDKFLSFN